VNAGSSGITRTFFIAPPISSSNFTFFFSSPFYAS
jgi:hypothetical protein